MRHRNPSGEIGENRRSDRQLLGPSDGQVRRVRTDPVPARRVAAPLVAECIANLECKVADTRFVKRYGLFILEVVQAWRDPTQQNAKTIHHRGRGEFSVDGKTIKLASRMP